MALPALPARAGRKPRRRKLGVRVIEDISRLADRGLDDVTTSANTALAEFVAQKCEALHAEIAKRRRRESEEDKDRDERFE